MYKCGRCNKTFSYESDHRRHLDRKTPCVREGGMPCPHCHRVYATKYTLERHVPLCHENKTAPPVAAPQPAPARPQPAPARPQPVPAARPQAAPARPQPAAPAPAAPAPAPATGYTLSDAPVPRRIIAEAPVPEGIPTLFTYAQVEEIILRLREQIVQEVAAVYTAMIPPAALQRIMEIDLSTAQAMHETVPQVMAQAPPPSLQTLIEGEPMFVDVERPAPRAPARRPLVVPPGVCPIPGSQVPVPQHRPMPPAPTTSATHPFTMQDARGFLSELTLATLTRATLKARFADYAPIDPGRIMNKLWEAKDEGLLSDLMGQIYMAADALYQSDMDYFD